MTELRRTYMEQAASIAADMFQDKTYAERAMPRRMLATTASYLLPAASVAAGMFYMQTHLAHMLPTWAAFGLGAILLAMLEVAKAQSARAYMRGMLKGGSIVTLELVFCVVCLAVTAGSAMQGARGAYERYAGAAVPSVVQQGVDIEQARKDALAPLREQAERIGAQRWKNDTDKAALLELARQQAAVDARFDAQLEKADQRAAVSGERIAADGRDIQFAVLLLELCIMTANMYLVYYYWRVWQETGRRQEIRRTMMRMAGDMEQEAQEQDAPEADDAVVASLLSRCSPAAAPAASASPRPIGFELPRQQLTEKERRFMELWASGERNPMRYTKELKVNFVQYRKMRERLVI